MPDDEKGSETDRGLVLGSGSWRRAEEAGDDDPERGRGGEAVGARRGGCVTAQAGDWRLAIGDAHDLASSASQKMTSTWRGLLARGVPVDTPQASPGTNTRRGPIIISKPAWLTRWGDPTCRSGSSSQSSMHSPLPRPVHNKLAIRASNASLADEAPGVGDTDAVYAVLPALKVQAKSAWVASSSRGRQAEEHNGASCGEVDGQARLHAPVPNAKVVGALGKAGLWP